MFEVPKVGIPRSAFNTSRGHKTTFDGGWLVPFFADEVLPGDTFRVNCQILARLATPISPLMDNIYLDTFFFFVPNRLIWDNWQRFCGEQRNPGDSTDFLVPQISLNVATVPAPPNPAATATQFWNYFGVPTFNVTVPGTGVFTFNNLHGRAYNLIWNEWFRDENLQTSAVVDVDDGPDNQSDYYLRHRGKRHDYFTSCLPWPQKDVGVNIPISGTAPVIASGSTPSYRGLTSGALGYLSTQATPPNVDMEAFSGSFSANERLNWDNPRLQVNLADNSGTINALRQAFQIQRLLERDARGGTRYTELVRSHFGVFSPDARLQRPEFLGGGSVGMIVHPIAQTSGTAVDPSTGYSPTVQGNLAGIGVASGHAGGFSKSFTEHGVLIGLICARPELTYQQGLRKMWRRRTKFDFYWPAFSHLGEQAVLNSEIFCNEDAQVALNDAVFGYQERWAEYRFAPSMVTGVFQSAYPGGTLDFWHLSENFTTRPVLGAAFIQSPQDVIDRVIAVEGEPQFIMDSWFNVKVVRPMPVYSVPGLVDHF